MRSRTKTPQKLCRNQSADLLSSPARAKTFPSRIASQYLVSQRRLADHLCAHKGYRHEIDVVSDALYAEFKRGRELRLSLKGNVFVNSRAK
jgi:hypothetical protein